MYYSDLGRTFTIKFQIIHRSEHYMATFLLDKDRMQIATHGRTQSLSPCLKELEVENTQGKEWEQMKIQASNVNVR